jgi:hypothetical protein
MSNAIANQLFLAYLGRPSDTAWRASTAAVIGSATAPSVALQNAFYSAAVLDGTFSLSDSSSQLVNKIFLNVFGFAARTDEQSAWAQLINNGTITAQTAAWTIFSSYLGATNVPDAYKLPAQSRIVALDAYTNQLANDSAANLAVSTLGGVGATSARTFLSGVTSQATAATAVSNIASTVSAAGLLATGTTFSLTTNPDNFTGTSSNDVFNALIGTGATLSSADTLNGGLGTDTLNIIYANKGGAVANGLQAATISGIETLNVRNTNATGDDGVTVSGANFTSVGHQGTGDVTFSNLVSGTVVTSSATGSALLTAGYAAAATNASLLLTGATLGNSSVTGAGLTTTTISSTTAANTTGTLDVAGTKTLNITATTNLTTGNITTSGTTATMTISGAAERVSIGTLNDNFTTVNASGLTAGGLTATMNAVATTVLTGGAGNDIITTGVALTTGSVAAGAGTGDRLIVGTTAHLNSASLGAKYTGFEQLQVNTGVSVDLDHISGITSVRVNDAAGATGFTNLSAAQAAAVTIVAADGTDGAVTLGVKGATTVGQIDTVSIDINDGAAAVGAAGAILLGPIALSGVEKLNITATDGSTIANLNSAAALDTITVTGAGATTITTGGTIATVNFTINGSAATGAQTYNATDFATNGVGLTGGSAADTLTGSAQVDIINGGAGNDTLLGLAGADTINGGDGNDTITGGTGADVINVGSGTDTYRFSATAGETQAGVVATGATLSGDVVTGMGNGDRIDLSAAANLVLADGTVAVGTTFATETANQVVIVSGSYNATTRVFTAGAASATNDDYLIQWNGGASATTVNTSVMVDIVGTLTATSAGEIITLTVA